MDRSFTPLKTESLKDLFIKEIEAKIISGQLKPGDRLPPEREIASLMGISRSIVNNGILELASKGFVKIIPRKGTIIEDYKKEGTPAILSSIMNYNEGKLSLKLFNGMMDTRLLIEVESAILSAKYRAEPDLRMLESYIDSIKDKPIDINNYVEFNYNFHHTITIASGNIVYAMIFKSFEPVCKNLIRLYFESGDYYKKSLNSHIDLYKAIKEKQPQKAGDLMKEILIEGRNKLEKVAIE
ncbi:DNA-binding transcriptional regulator, FadR family [Natronincola peptidivorans]|uniref:DNA-binding transcriptional regulator, FadR family n=1 Tax=Natronincola peptidivorans TaxID=426128 RepID=A0A1H9Y4X6_9FIRM|nr:FCD domain-containing protein [Natronincola peptidivorans]SES63423.1 DNA-binding transcriptional regulator, FadR family [Natronincola peptidivorans]